jgi:hypothetical protein
LAQNPGKPVWSSRSVIFDFLPARSKGVSELKNPPLDGLRPIDQFTLHD